MKRFIQVRNNVAKVRVKLSMLLVPHESDSCSFRYVYDQKVLKIITVVITY